MDKGLNICGQGSVRWVLVEVLAGCLPGVVGGCGLGGMSGIEWVDAMQESCQERESISCRFGLGFREQAWHLGPV